MVPPRKSAKLWKPTSPAAVARNEALRASKYLWRRWSGDHRRSRVEAKRNCIKLLGQSLMARDFDRQVAELQVRIVVLSGYTALGIPVTVAVRSVRPGKGEPRSDHNLCNNVFGGVKQSGLGREGGHEGMLEFMETQYISASW